ncbi:GLPGLI family protein [Hymenobacter endophyticus]|uniref:GLPGLI family protein n=1 Tax=Hymenobacter endophyticus TaxID=3076335 RepID=A0ABU3TJY7_9BACT|nr:GLPGLI family protein [Hymenobacter endophyticus]MDU0371676.1 GLPGLI family protein [Hymenobacter endophyticus]
MMRKSFFLFFIIAVLFGNLCYAQGPPIDTCKLLITYRLTYYPDSTSNEKKIEQMRLTIGNSSSIFESIGQYKKDTMRLNNQSKPIGIGDMQRLGNQALTLGRSNFRYQIYKNTNQPFIYYHERIMRQSFYYKESNDIIKWKITNSKKNIAGYSCQLATTFFSGRNIEAWFTREIPHANGPYKFGGLPGLIIELSDSKRHYSFEFLKSETPKDKILILSYDDAIETTKQKFNQAKRDYEINLSDKIAAMGHPVSQEDRKDYKDRLNKKNNPLELK